MKKSPRTRTTQQDIAKAAGVNRATVSLALREHPSIPATTRARIQKIATKFGYVPDPMLTALAAYRHGRRPAEFRGTLGWLAQTTAEFQWRAIPHFVTYLEAARARAEFHGYRVEILDLQELGISWTRAASIAKSRGIDGILLCPQPYPDLNLADFPWQEFAAVTFGYSIINPKLNSVAPAQYRASFAVMKELLARGYQRIGFSIQRGHDIRTDHNYLAGYLAARELHDPETPVPVLLTENHKTGEIPASFLPWLKRHRPDAIVTNDIKLLPALKEAGFRVPEELGVACPLLSGPDGDLSGVIEDNGQLGLAAVDFLVSMLHRGERGIPPHPQRLLVEGVWNPGRSLRSRPSD